MVSGGTPTYTYAWSGPNGFTSSTANISNLLAGDYTFIVTDANACSDTETFTIDEPTTLAIDAGGTTVMDTGCNGETGRTSSRERG